MKRREPRPAPKGPPRVSADEEEANRQGRQRRQDEKTNSLMFCLRSLLGVLGALAVPSPILSSFPRPSSDNTAVVSDSENLQRINLHAAAVGLTSFVPALSMQIEHLFGEFRASAWPERAVPISGTIWPYEQSHVLKHLSPTARRVATPGYGLLELYEEGERFWLVDDRWGLAEINLLKGQWRSWILPAPALDTVRCVRQAVLWPMAQLLRARGLYLLPAASVSFADRSFLILSPFGIEPELTALIRGGWRVIGQSWTALREDEAGRFTMLHLPGYVERPVPPGMRLSHGDAAPTWVDLMQEHTAAEQRQGRCDAVLVVDPGRRPQADVRPLDRPHGSQALRAAWPVFELHPNRRHGQLPSRLAAKVPTYQLHLSREPHDLLKILTELKTSPPQATSAPTTLRAAG